MDIGIGIADGLWEFGVQAWLVGEVAVDGAALVPDGNFARCATTIGLVLPVE
jgi:hypothetical protein